MHRKKRELKAILRGNDADDAEVLRRIGRQKKLNELFVRALKIAEWTLHCEFLGGEVYAETPDGQRIEKPPFMKIRDRKAAEEFFRGRKFD